MPNDCPRISSEVRCRRNCFPAAFLFHGLPELPEKENAADFFEFSRRVVLEAVLDEVHVRGFDAVLPLISPIPRLSDVVSAVGKNYEQVGFVFVVIYEKSLFIDFSP